MRKLGFFILLWMLSVVPNEGLRALTVTPMGDLGIAIEIPGNFTMGKNDWGAADDHKKNELVLIENRVFEEAKRASPQLNLQALPVGDLPSIMIAKESASTASVILSLGSQWKKSGKVITKKIGDFDVEIWPGYPGPYGDTAFYYVIRNKDGGFLSFMAHRKHWAGKLTGQETHYDRTIESLIGTMSLLVEEKPKAALTKVEYLKNKTLENAKSTQARYDYASELFLKNEFDRALEETSEILKLDPKHALALGLKSGIEEVKATPEKDRPLKKLRVMSDQMKLLEPQLNEMKDFAEAMKSTPMGQEHEKQDRALREEFEKRFLPLAAEQYKQSIQESKDLMGLVFQLEMDGKGAELEVELEKLKAKYPNSAEILDRRIANAQRMKNWNEFKRLVSEGRKLFPRQVSFIIYEEMLRTFEDQKSDEQREAWALDLLMKKSKWSQIYFDYQMKAMKNPGKSQ